MFRSTFCSCCHYIYSERDELKLYIWCHQLQKQLEITSTVICSTCKMLETTGGGNLEDLVVVVGTSSKTSHGVGGGDQ